MTTRLMLALALMGCDGQSAQAPDAMADACSPLSSPAADCADPCYDTLGPQMVMEFAPTDLGLAAPAAGSRPIRIALFVSVAPQPQGPLTAWSRQDVIDQWMPLLRDTSTVFAQCNMHLEVEAMQVIALPARLLDLQGNEAGSFGGHPPPGTPNPDLFDYEQHERLTAESVELFRYGKQFSSKNAISVFTVEDIVYYSNQMLSAAGGLSNPPNIYHHPDDYPYRNSVLVVPERFVCGGLPRPTVRPGTLGQEIGHMLLNTGGHVTEPSNLMNDGTVISPAQCLLMEENLSLLFGDAEVPDPGPPT